MSLASNMREQLMKRLKRDLELAAPEFALIDAQLTDGSPALQLQLSAVTVAMVAIKRKSFVGMNVVAELSSSAGEGLPEHDCWLVVDENGLAMPKACKLAAIAKKLGTSSLKIVSDNATPSEALIIESAVDEEIANDARLGAVGA